MSEHAPTAATRAGVPPVPVSVVMTVLDEARHLADAVRCALEQDHPGEIEVVVALGPSGDGTHEVAHALADADPRVRVVDNPDPRGATPAGLNAAIAAARHEVLVRVDGHALLPPTYVSTAVAALERTGAVNVGGVMAAEGTTAFESAVARAMTSKIGVGSAPYHTGGGEGPADSVYLGVFRRAALERVGGFDEAFSRAQDWELNHRLRAAGGVVWFVPELQVAYRPRSTVKALARQYFHYGRWRRVIVRRSPDTASARFLAPPVAVLAVAGGTVLGLAGVRLGWLAPGGYLAGVLVGSAATSRGLAPEAALRLPLVYVTMHGAWGLGFLTSPARLARDAAAGERRRDEA